MVSSAVNFMLLLKNVEFLETKPKSNEAENSAPDNNNNGWAE